ncbi:MAG: hypothetical protein MUE94_13950 [Verrucomicrobia bacterium]|jgi:3-deoxy-D-manno-octulosonic-acid transferase|nr:hypothetical protein [Verrucomicrobiota bacterium]
MRFVEQLVLWLYIGAMNVLMPLGILLSLPYLLLKEKRRKPLLPRLGLQVFPTLATGLSPVWIHALSLGETLSCVTLVETLRQQLGSRPIVFSVSTLSAMHIAQERIRPWVDGLFYFPLDLWWPVRRALRQISPALIVFIETDVWPGFQRQVFRAGIPALLVNGRLSPDTYKACSRFRSLFAPALNGFARIYPQSESEAKRYLDVGVRPDRMGVCGNLKFDVARREPGVGELAALRQRLGLSERDVVLLAGSTHPGEEEMVIRAFEIVREQIPNAKLILVPRHPARAIGVSQLSELTRHRVHHFSQLVPAADWDVLIVDVMGVLSKLYHVASVSFVGGSLVSKGGQNPLESAAAGCPVMMGPDMRDFPDIAAGMLEAGAAQTIASASELGQQWLGCLRDVQSLDRKRKACRAFVQKYCGVTDAIVREIISMLG